MEVPSPPGMYVCKANSKDFGPVRIPVTISKLLNNEEGQVRISCK